MKSFSKFVIKSYLLSGWTSLPKMNTFRTFVHELDLDCICPASINSEYSILLKIYLLHNHHHHHVNSKTISTYGIQQRGKRGHLGGQWWPGCWGWVRRRHGHHIEPVLDEDCSIDDRLNFRHDTIPTATIKVQLVPNTWNHVVQSESFDLTIHQKQKYTKHMTWIYKKHQGFLFSFLVDWNHWGGTLQLWNCNKPEAPLSQMIWSQRQGKL